ncbi:hypothetical protein FIBSPDRAFT_876908, partial [Athelia psychrophila]
MVVDLRRQADHHQFRVPARCDVLLEDHDAASTRSITRDWDSTSTPGGDKNKDRDEGNMGPMLLSSYHPDTRYPTNERMFLSRLSLQLGMMFDYLTGEHAPNLSSKLQQALAFNKRDLATLDYPYTPSQHAEFDSVNNRIKALIPERPLLAFSQFSVTSSWPPTYLVHGSNDSAVLA